MTNLSLSPVPSPHQNPESTDQSANFSVVKSYQWKCCVQYDNKRSPQEMKKINLLCLSVCVCLHVCVCACVCLHVFVDVCVWVWVNACSFLQIIGASSRLKTPAEKVGNRERTWRCVKFSFMDWPTNPTFSSWFFSSLIVCKNRTYCSWRNVKGCLDAQGVSSKGLLFRVRLCDSLSQDFVPFGWTNVQVLSGLSPPPQFIYPLPQSHGQEKQQLFAAATSRKQTVISVPPKIACLTKHIMLPRCNYIKVRWCFPGNQGMFPTIT